MKFPPCFPLCRVRLLGYPESDAIPGDISPAFGLEIGQIGALLGKMDIEFFVTSLGVSSATSPDATQMRKK